jgi:predicted transcriptional regulator of viral defense system
MAQSPIEEYLKTSESKALEVLFWLLHNRDSENIIYTTLDTVAEECQVTKVTVNRVFQRLYKDGFLVKLRNGRYQLHKI